MGFSVTAQDILTAAILDSHGYHKPIIKLPAFSCPGAYQITYYTEDFESLCADCATKEIRAWMYGENDDPPVIQEIHYEGPSEFCAGCNKEMESVYGDPDATPCTIRETMSGFICQACGSDCECVVCAIQEKS
jgi:hypothetical protein